MSGSESTSKQVAGKVSGSFPDDLYEWQDIHECAHFLLTRTAKSSVGM
jgi:hypothetical protein